MSLISCNCSSTKEPEIIIDQEEYKVSNAMKKFGYNSVPGLRQTTQVEIDCLKNAVVGSKENTMDCLSKCEEARLSTCLDKNNVPIPSGYCNNACSQTTTKENTSGTKDPEEVFKSCSEGAVKGKCFPNEFSACIREKCETDTNCISSSSALLFNFCKGEGDTSPSPEKETDVNLEQKDSNFYDTIGGKATFTFLGLLVLVFIIFFLYRYFKKNGGTTPVYSSNYRFRNY